jgi:hypothetical protein
MDDREVGTKIYTDAGKLCTNPHEPGTWFAAVGAAARAALTGPVPTRGDVLEWCDREGHMALSVDTILAALRHFARAPGGNVPSVDEIAHEMIRTYGGTSANTAAIAKCCATVAHALMLRIGGRAEMMIDGMSVQGIEEAFLKDAFAPTDKITRQCMDHAAHEAFRLATTPRTVDDPDKEAKRLAWEFHKAAFTTFDAASPDELWATFKDYQLVGWRAVAKGKADE